VLCGKKNKINDREGAIADTRTGARLGDKNTQRILRMLDYDQYKIFFIPQKLLRLPVLIAILNGHQKHQCHCNSVSSLQIRIQLHDAAYCILITAPYLRQSSCRSAREPA
jgi:hypothetical protein